MAQALLGAFRAAGVNPRAPHDRLAFAVHSHALAHGYRLVGVGDDVKLEGLKPDAPDATVSGWDARSGEQYSFLYLADGSGTAPEGSSLLAKCLALGDQQMVTLAAAPAGVAEPAEPQVVDLDVARYTTDDDTSNVAKSLQHVDELAMRLSTALAEATAPLGADAGSKKQKTAAPAEQAAGAEVGASGGNRRPEPEPDYDPLRIGPPMRPQPLRAGYDDVVPLHPGGFPDPLAPGGMLPGGPPGGVPGMGHGGGMHVGPEHPFFSDRMRHPELQPHARPPGARWDPIRPQGLEGWQPDDFQGPGIGPGRGMGRGPPGSGQGPPGVHPDIQQPGAGGGINWDSMFG